MVERYAYDPFGAVTVLNTDYTAKSGGTVYAWTVLFQGLRQDPTSGLDEADRRRYSPTLGRWTANDPIAFDAKDSNPYRFVGDSPATYTDPLGTQIRITDIEVNNNGASEIWKLNKLDDKMKGAKLVENQHRKTLGSEFDANHVAYGFEVFGTVLRGPDTTVETPEK